MVSHASTTLGQHTLVQPLGSGLGSEEVRIRVRVAVYNYVGTAHPGPTMSPHLDDTSAPASLQQKGTREDTQRSAHRTLLCMGYGQLIQASYNRASTRFASTFTVLETGGFASMVLIRVPA